MKWRQVTAQRIPSPPVVHHPGMNPNPGYAGAVGDGITDDTLAIFKQTGFMGGPFHRNLHGPVPAPKPGPIRSDMSIQYSPVTQNRVYDARIVVTDQELHLLNASDASRASDVMHQTILESLTSSLVKIMRDECGKSSTRKWEERVC